MTAEVIPFPTTYNPDQPPNTVEEMVDALAEVKADYVEEVSEFTVALLFHQLALAGFNVSDQALDCDATMVQEAIKAFMLKTYKMKHTLHPLSAVLFDRNKRIVVVKIDEHEIKPEPPVTEETTNA